MPTDPIIHQPFTVAFGPVAGVIWMRVRDRVRAGAPGIEAEYPERHQLA